MDLMLTVEKQIQTDFKVVYRNTVFVPDGIKIPFERLLDGLSLLYPNHVYRFVCLNYKSHF